MVGAVDGVDEVEDGEEGEGGDGGADEEAEGVDGEQAACINKRVEKKQETVVANRYCSFS